MLQLVNQVEAQNYWCVVKIIWIFIKKNKNKTKRNLKPQRKEKKDKTEYIVQCKSVGWAA